MGRLFDAVASLLGLSNYITYQAQAAIKLETAASEANSRNAMKTNESYCYQIEYNEGYFIINTVPIISDIVKDIKAGVSREVIAGKFHNTVIDFSVSFCELIREKYNINTAALSGRVFQNKVITEGIYKRLREKGFKVYIHSRIPCNDGGLSVGQLVIANYMKY